MLHNRISPGLFGGQLHDQHAFRPDVRLEDALLVVENVVESVVDKLERGMKALKVF